MTSNWLQAASAGAMAVTGSGGGRFRVTRFVSCLMGELGKRGLSNRRNRVSVEGKNSASSEAAPLFPLKKYVVTRLLEGYRRETVGCGHTRLAGYSRLQPVTTCRDAAYPMRSRARHAPARPKQGVAA